MTIGIHTPPGRPLGIPNKATRNAREAIAAFVDGNAHRLTEWLDRIAEDNPKAAFDAFQSIIEYHIPKLQRTDNTNTNIGIVQIVLEASKHRALADAVKAGGDAGVVLEVDGLGGALLNDHSTDADTIDAVTDAIATSIP